MKLITCLFNIKSILIDCVKPQSFSVQIIQEFQVVLKYIDLLSYFKCNFRGFFLMVTFKSSLFFRFFIVLNLPNPSEKVSPQNPCGVISLLILVDPRLAHEVWFTSGADQSQSRRRNFNIFWKSVVSVYICDFINGLFFHSFNI